ncbi:hypothetical protein OG875_05015 [Streptomyces sp. NBC_01498]|uniref:hypothetical protein n=1 Tax=Streptomyces sp. NBC_01498 TaxID=2975870 RepID=UPI002E7B79B8|nr:hypothetical protein [Streptomyces sp. NBC_01498]WTL24018.1 hypothetical protein OG875_05015 [Streptomyces sp. NBC_01498]
MSTASLTKPTPTPLTLADAAAHRAASSVRPTAPALSVGDVYVAAATAAHLARCAGCRAGADETERDARAAGESMARRDRRDLGRRVLGPREVAS